jgi:TIGR03009 family protein
MLAASVSATALEARAQAPGGAGQPPVAPRQQVPVRVAQPGEPRLATLPQTPPQIPVSPFRLSAEEEAQLSQVLEGWERESDKVKTLTCAFYLRDYDGVFGKGNAPKREFKGDIKFAAPDKGTYFEDIPGGQYWVCDGKSIYSFDNPNKLVREYPLPQELQGKAITNGPLPFVFGAKVIQMKQRYFMRVVSVFPANANNPKADTHIMLEAYPRYPKDAANFQRVEVILSQKSMLPIGMQIYETNGKSRKSYTFYDVQVNGLFDKIKDFFAPPTVPFGWKHVVDQVPAENKQAAQQPPGATPKQAQRSSTLPLRR